MLIFFPPLYHTIACRQNVSCRNSSPRVGKMFMNCRCLASLEWGVGAESTLLTHIGTPGSNVSKCGQTSWMSAAVGGRNSAQEIYQTYTKNIRANKFKSPNKWFDVHQNALTETTQYLVMLCCLIFVSTFAFLDVDMCYCFLNKKHVSQKRHL